MFFSTNLTASFNPLITSCIGFPYILVCTQMVNPLDPELPVIVGDETNISVSLGKRVKFIFLFKPDNQLLSLNSISKLQLCYIATTIVISTYSFETSIII